MNRIEKGNNPERWKLLLDELDHKLQLGLLTQLQKIDSYHFETNDLYIEVGDSGVHEYLTRDTVFQQLEIFCRECIKVDKVSVTLKNS